MNFQTIALVKHPLPSAWITMRDQLPHLAEYLDDIESITTNSRVEDPEGVSIVNLWKAKPKLPDALARHIDMSKFSWIDSAYWNESRHHCSWSIEPQVFKEHINCHGETRFEPAMGGKGTRITFSGEAEIKIGLIDNRANKLLENTLSKAVMMFSQGLISKNFRKITDALGLYLGSS